MPIQSLLITNGVNAFFHGHDHLFVKEDLDVNGDGQTDHRQRVDRDVQRVKDVHGNEDGDGNARRNRHDQGRIAQKKPCC